jgi:UDP-glucuronate decarboxylase
MKVVDDTIVLEDAEIVLQSGLPWKEMEGKTILVAGAAGFIASHILSVLWRLRYNCRADGMRIICLVRNAKRARERLGAFLPEDAYELLEQDVCDPLNLDQGCDVIIHAASQASPRYYGMDPVGTLSANVEGTQRLLEHARQYGCEHFLFLSSGAVYGQVEEHQVPIRETSYGYLDPATIGACYGESKRMGETMCVAWHRQYGVPAVVMRPFHTYGPGYGYNDGRMIADFVADVIQERDLTLNSNGSATRSLCYVSDCVTGLFTVLLCGEPGQVYNVGDDRHEMSILELAELMAGLYPEKGLEVHINARQLNEGYIKSLNRRRCPDVKRLRALGWTPHVTLEEGLRRTIRSYS